MAGVFGAGIHWTLEDVAGRDWTPAGDVAPDAQPASAAAIASVPAVSAGPRLILMIRSSLFGGLVLRFACGESPHAGQAGHA
jgi:hypothetical protein